MLNSTDCFKMFGAPTPENEPHFMILWDVPQSINDAIPALPNRIYCNKHMPKLLERAFRTLIVRGLHPELMTYDGCFNVRPQRGTSLYSLHSWGIAIDINAAWNGLGKPPKLSKAFVDCFKEAGFDWGGDWKMPRTDGMHFQLKSIL